MQTHSHTHTHTHSHTHTLTHTLTHTHSQIIAKYLNEVEDVETRLQLATDVQLYDIGLECLKQLKEHARLESYINYIPPNRQREFREKIRKLASNSVS